MWQVVCLDVYMFLCPGNWVIVTHTEGMHCRTMLDNILCGIMYRQGTLSYYYLAEHSKE